MNIQSSHQAYIDLLITNALQTGIIVVRNPTLTSGEFVGDYTTQEHYYGSVHNRTIYPRMLQTISAHANTRSGSTSGTIPLYEGYTKIGTLEWYCPGGRGRNSVQAYDVNANYRISIGNFDPSGPIGEVHVTVQRA